MTDKDEGSRKLTIIYDKDDALIIGSIILCMILLLIGYVIMLHDLGVTYGGL